MSELKEISELKQEYEDLSPNAHRFIQELVKQINTLVNHYDVKLGFPIQSRVKSWESIEEKISRNDLNLKSIQDLHDFIGIRVIFLFKRDEEIFKQVITDKLNIIDQEDTSTRLKEDQFGYSSMHYTVCVPDEWLVVPALSYFEGMKAEIQVRTVAQHLWADASHILQYKNESNVPEPIKRSIYRVSAILEMVDLEFERVLMDRDTYRQEATPTDGGEEKLNIDLLEITLDTLLPNQNKDDNERYDQLLRNLNDFNIFTVSKLKDLIIKNYDYMLIEEQNALNDRISQGLIADDNEDRILHKKVFYTYAGLVRQALENEFKETWQLYRDENLTR